MVPPGDLLLRFPLPLLAPGLLLRLHLSLHTGLLLPLTLPEGLLLQLLLALFPELLPLRLLQAVALVPGLLVLTLTYCLLSPGRLLRRLHRWHSLRLVVKGLPLWRNCNLLTNCSKWADRSH